MDNKTEYLKKLHGELLEIMDVIAAICDNNNLSYYLTGGSLLGAIRHKGFIPWDDDLDIVMPRDDYERFIELCSTQLPEEYYLDWISTNKGYVRLFAKICKKGTQVIQGSMSYGIFVDIFPLDETFGYNRKIEFRKYLIQKLAIVLGAKRKKIKLGLLKDFIVKVIPQSCLQILIRLIMKKDNGRCADYYTNYASQYPVKRWTINKMYFSDGVIMPFETRSYKVPSNYTAVLESIFGVNYMCLPPIEKRRSHYPLFVKFSDGMEMRFDVPLKKISVLDTIS